MGRWLASLRVRLLLLVLLTLIPVLGLLLYTSVERRREAAAEAEEKALRVVRLAAVQHEQLIENARRLLRALTQLPAVRIRDGRTCNALLADVMQQYPFYTNLTAATPTGEVFCSALPLARPLSLADREWYQRLLRTGEFVVGEYELGRVSGKPTVILAHPFRDHAGQLQGLVTLGLDLSWVNQLAMTVHLPQGSSLLVIDRNGTILVRHPDPGKWMGRRISEATVVKAVLAQGGEGTASLSGEDGVRRLYAFKPLGACRSNSGDTRVPT